ncbi:MULTISPECIES: AI-2E family transporter [Anaerostipes]|uniref:AI-2E family transporter n=1 Tax=Anaerostipes TaxID=207244 RepID=UPI000951CF06|nr:MULTISPECIES: AI-2E family transporter [Anaerostipes]MCI5624195.1 AI-2E family transporter [Anaerostipes sp.]OLR58954.1 sporulation protein [Anaerostipes sp. 494a]
MKRWEIYLDIIMELLVIVAGAILIIFVLPKVLGFLWPFVAGWIISLIAHPVIEYLEKKIKIPKKFGSAVLIIAVISAILAILYLIIRLLGTQIINFIQGFPDLRLEMSQQIGKFQGKVQYFVHLLPHGFQNQMLKVAGSLGQVVQKMATGIGDYGVSHAGSMAKGMTNGLIGVVVMFFSSYVFLKDKEKFIKMYQQMIPDVIKHKIDIFVHNTLGVLGSYCLAQIKIMFIVMAILWIGLKVAGVQYAFIFAVLIGIVDIFPILGTGTVIIPWALVKLVTGDIKSAVIFLIVYAICLILKQVLQPKMMGATMGISALTTIFLIYVGFKLGGLGGMLLTLILGMFTINLYRLGIFDRKIAFFRKRIEMLTINSEKEESEDKES